MGYKLYDTKYIDKNVSVAREIARIVDSMGGKTYYVGGYVRDKLLGIESKDIDIEVFGISPSRLKDVCSKIGTVDEVGMSFGILKIHGFDLDISIPRKERQTGSGHKGFDIDLDPFSTERQAAERRDFTMNAIMLNVVTGEFVDPFCGRYDLRHEIIRAVNEKTFIEDPLRVFRAAQFAARFEFQIEQNTLDLCKTIDVSSLARERVFEETNKALMKSQYPSLYFENLREMNQLDVFFPEVKSLIGVSQNPAYHPEGDVWNHTMDVLNRAAFKKASAWTPLGFMYAALLHDIGKPLTTENDNGIIRSIGHEIKGADLAKTALLHLTNKNNLIKYIANMVENHMGPHQIQQSSSLKTTNRFLDKCIAPYDQILLGECDTPKRRVDEYNLYETGWWAGRLHEYEKIIAEPEVTGDDLIALGYEPGPMFSKLLKKCHLIHLAGVKKENVLRQIPSIVAMLNRRDYQYQEYQNN